MNKGIAIGGEFKKPTWLISFILIATFLFVDKFTEKSSWSIVKYIAEDWSVMNRVGILAIVHWGLPYIAVPMIVTAFLFGKNTVFDKLGLNRSVIKGLGFAFAVTLPLPLVYGFTTPISQTGELIPDILHYAIFAGTAEEILFRCFLFGLLFRTARWGFLPAALLGAVIFGFGHIYQGNSILESAGVFFITFVGALWWAWLYVEWNYNAWVPIGLHVFMNGWHNVFVVSETALLPITAEIARVSVVLISIIVTLRLTKQRGRTVKGSLWWRA